MTAKVLKLKPVPVIIPSTSRPYRLWDSHHKRHIPHRCYGHRVNAYKAALWLVTISPDVGTIEVYDCSDGQLLAQFTQRVDGTIKIYMKVGELVDA